MKKGFTLVEMIAVMSLMSFMIGAVLVNYRESTNRQKVTQAVLQLKQTMETAKSNALNGRKDVAVCGSGPGATLLDGWRVNSPMWQNYYTLQGKCGGSYFPDSPIQVSMPSDVDLSINRLLVTSILFKPMGQGVDIPFGYSDITYRINGNNYDGTVSVNMAGEISVSAITQTACNSIGTIPCNNSGLLCCGSCLIFICI